MKITEAERLIKKWKEAKERKTGFQIMRHFVHENTETVSISFGSSEIKLRPEEQQMIFNILNNTINEREKNYREMLKEQLNIDEEV